MRLITKTLIFLLSTTFVVPIYAQSFTSFDPRSMALGGSGVADARAKNAALFNPALLSKKPSQFSEAKFASVFAGVRLIDRDNFLESLDQYQANNNETKLSNALANFNSRVESGNLRVIDARNVLTASNNWLTDIQTLSDKPLRVSASGGFSTGYQSKKFAFSFHYRKTLVLGSVLEITNDDIQSVQSVLQFLDYFVDLAENEDVPDEFNVPLPYLVEESTSSVDVRGASYDEKGFTISTAINSAETSNVGITIKQMTLENFHFSDRIQAIDLDDFSVERYQRTYRDLNLDLGLSGQLSDRLSWGLVARNLIDKTYLTAQGHQQRFKPQFRAGLSLHTGQFKLSADIDLTRNDPLGYDPDKKFLALGFERKFGAITALRMGYRHNLIDHTKLISLGVGIDSKYAQFDFAVAGQGDELGASLQASLSF